MANSGWMAKLVQVELRFEALFVLTPDDFYRQSSVFFNAISPLFFEMAIAWGNNGDGNHSTNFTLSRLISKLRKRHSRFWHCSNH